MKKEYILVGLVILLIGTFGIYKVLGPKNQLQSTPLVLPKMERGINSVDVTIDYLPEKSNATTSVFQITLNTHSVNLNTVDFRKDLTIEKNGKVIPVSEILSSEGEGHHRTAVVSFPATIHPFTIVLSNISGVARTEFVYSK